jgi:uncharacterized membrane protein AbrB (regulator of aidB expression)
MSSSAVYFAGFSILVLALAFAAYLLNLPLAWIVGGVMAIIGIATFIATRSRKPPSGMH